MVKRFAWALSCVALGVLIAWPGMAAQVTPRPFGLHTHQSNAQGGTLASAALQGDLGYSLQFSAGSSIGTNPADATTYYFGNYSALAPNTGAERQVEYAPIAGTLTKAYVDVFCTVAATSENVTVAVSINGSTTVNISTTSQWTSAGTLVTVSNTGLSQAVSAGDRFQIKIVTPTWATNPTTCTYNATIWIHEA